MATGRNGCGTLSDDALMERVRVCDAEAFAELYDRHGRLAFRLAHSICRDAGSAEDAVQEGFLNLWRSRGSYRADRGSVRVWVLSIVRNRAIDSLRRDAVRPPVAATQRPEGFAESSGNGIDHELVLREDREAIRQAIASLPDCQAEVITLAFYGEISHAEIASYLGIPPGTVKGRMRLGLEKLRRQVRA